mmetsp:Transcript_52271/g.144765  ORF Transcript_52271/g.144765 Transcript_52271/m.144765 type:complete len:200 (+) Transcript_52271:299-898(+)
MPRARTSRSEPQLRVEEVSPPAEAVSSRSVRTWTLRYAFTPSRATTSGSSPSKPASRNWSVGKIALPRKPMALSLTANTRSSPSTQPSKTALWFQGWLLCPRMMMVEKKQSDLPGISHTQQGSDLSRLGVTSGAARTARIAIVAECLPWVAECAAFARNTKQPFTSESHATLISSGGYARGSLCSIAAPALPWAHPIVP